MSAQTSTTTRRGFIRLLGAAGCTALLAPALAKAGTSPRPSGQQAVPEAPLARCEANNTAKKRLCPCCEG